VSSAAPSNREDIVLGVFGAVLLHAAAIALMFRGVEAREAAPRVLPMRTFMVAAPKGDVSVGVVQAPAAEPTNTPAPRAAERLPDPPKTTPVTTTKTKPAVVPKEATVTPNASKSVKNAPTAGSEAGGKGADLANVDLGGTEFPYPAYQRNIVNRIAEQFRSTERRSAEVMFIIRRDGSVDPEQMQLVTRSGSYTFDNAALGAIEAVANRKLFGPLPADFKNDALTVIFRFDPAIFRPE
jgi:outer membrane biosynthesis protein TonB